MRDHHVGNVVVVKKDIKGNIPIGIVTDRDIVVELITNLSDLTPVIVGDLMSDKLLTAQETDGVMEAVKKMRHEGVRRVPVIDKKDALVGIFSIDDMINLLAEQQMDIAGLIHNEQRNEARLRI